MLPTDEELIARVASRDREAFSLLYDRFASRAFGLCLHFLAIHADAEDVLQETFLQIWDQAHRFDVARCMASGWILMIARSRAVDRLRRRRAASVELPHDLPANHSFQSSDAERQDNVQPIVNALKDLPPEQRQAIELAFYGGLTHEQIAMRLELPLGTVKTRIRLGMIRLRDRLNIRNQAADE